MIDDTDPKLILRGIGRGLDRRFPPAPDTPDAIARLLDALRRRDLERERQAQAG